MPDSQPFLEYELYLPTISPQGTLYSQDILRQTRQELIDFFGGLTDTRQKNEGLWKIGGVTVRDEIVIWRILSNRGQAGDQFIRNAKTELQKLLRQNEILVVRRQVERMFS
ncbi:MAG: hypothetical protein ACJ763_05230 [Bdellovibrionia bacterium]